MKALLAVLVAFAAADAFADDPKPFRSLNGRTQLGGPAEAPRGGPQPGAQPGQAGFNAGPEPSGAGPAPTLAGGAGAYTNNRAFFGGKGGSGARNIRGAQKSGKNFRLGNGRLVGTSGLPGGAGGATTTTSDPGSSGTNEDPPPYMTTWGAKILTAGQQPKYNDPSQGEREHRIDAGEIVFNPKKAYDVGKAPTLANGPKDTLPTPNPGTSGRSYGSGISANGPATGATSGSGKDNNGSGNNGKDKPGDDDDGHGGSKKAESDPTGFYSAF